jgi:hypothetical protein
MTMISTRQLRALFGALALLGAFASQAAAAPLMTYQGRLKESGLPVSGNKSVDILFCNCLSGVCAPACVSSVPQSVAVSSGLFRTTFTVPSSVDLNAGPWFLEVKIGAVTLSPREELTNSPYAVVASSANGLAAASGAAGVSVSSHLVVASGSRVGIGTNAPAAALHVYSTTVNGARIRVEGSGASGNPNITVKAVSGAGEASLTLDRADTGSPSSLDFYTAGVADWYVRTPASASGQLNFLKSDGATVIMTLLQGGNVGIGSTSPALNLSMGNTAARTFGVEDTGAITATGKSLSIQGGAGGTLATGGIGGDLSLKAGAAGGTGNNNGGSVVLQAGDNTSTAPPCCAGSRPPLLRSPDSAAAAGRRGQHSAWEPDRPICTVLSRSP